MILSERRLLFGLSSNDALYSPVMHRSASRVNGYDAFDMSTVSLMCHRSKKVDQSRVGGAGAKWAILKFSAALD